jgi:RND family efflux transporter MFP subunit
VKFSIDKHPRWLAAGAVVLVVVVVAVALPRLTRTAPDVPTAEVRKGEFVDYIAVRGDVAALRSLTIAAPIGIVGGDMQILELVKSGTAVKKGDIICDFDGTSIQRLLDQRQTELKAAEAEIDRSRANAHMIDEQNSTDLLNATYNVERGKLDVSKGEILSEIDAEKTKLSLSNYEQRLSETQQRVKSGHISNNADIESRKQRRDKALYDVRLAQRQLAALTLVAPTDGMVTVLPNFRAGGRGVAPPEFKEGDRAWPGASIAQIPDLSAILVSARVDESDRGRLKVGQQVTIRVDAVPDREFGGTVTDISPLAKLDFSGWPITKNFDIEIKVDTTDARIRPGMSASARIILERVPDSVLVPNTAVFQKNGRAVVYVLKGSAFQERQVEIARRSASEMTVRAGLQPGERVALKDPTMPQEQAR